MKRSPINRKACSSRRFRRSRAIGRPSTTGASVEAKLNALPQFITEIDGLDIHFIHVRSKHENALPLIVTHGWPGSIVEQMKIIDPLTNPTAHGGSASDAFHLVIPSMPGYGFSGKPTTTGWDPAHIARAWIVLMKRLGYTKFVAQGGDWGAIITELMGAQAPPELLGIHTNMANVIPLDIDKAAFSGAPAPAGLSADEKIAYERLTSSMQRASATASRWGCDRRRCTESRIHPSAWRLISSITTRAAMSSSHASLTDSRRPHARRRPRQHHAHLVDEHGGFWRPSLLGEQGGVVLRRQRRRAIPVAVSVFPDELYPAPRSWAERAYPKLIHYNKLDKGGHFAAWEQPELFSEESARGLQDRCAISRNTPSADLSSSRALRRR